MIKYSTHSINPSIIHSTARSLKSNKYLTAIWVMGTQNCPKITKKMARGFDLPQQLGQWTFALCVIPQNFLYVKRFSYIEIMWENLSVRKNLKLGFFVNLRFAPADHNGWTGYPAGRLINWSFYLRNLSGRTLAVVTVLNLAAGYLVGF